MKSILSEINDHLDAFGADFEIGAEVKLPVEVGVEEETIETYVRAKITEDDTTIVDPDAQVERILQEIKDRVEN